MRFLVLLSLALCAISMVNAQQTIALEVEPTSLAEDAAGQINFVFTRDGSTVAQTIPFTVSGTSDATDWTIGGATSFNTTDFTGTVVMPANMNSVNVSFDPTADAIPEADETIIVTLGADPAYTRNTTTPVVATILNDELYNVTVIVTPTTIAENSTTNAIVTFTRSNAPTTASLVVSFSVSGTAALDSDYTTSGATTFFASNGTVTFNAGESEKNVTIDPTDDVVGESSETLVITLVAGVTYQTSNPSSATLTITDNDPQGVTVEAVGSPVLENSGTFTFKFSRVGDGADQPLEVNFTVSGTAGFGPDYNVTGATSYTATTGSITFPANVTEVSITVAPVGDSDVEPDETVIISLQAGTGYTVGNPNAATGVIANDDATVTLSVAPSSVPEDGEANLVFTFTRTGFTNSSLQVQFNVSGTAGFNQDYTVSGALTFASTLGTVSIPAGNTSISIIVNPTADNNPEEDETVILQLIAGAGYNIGTANAVTGTITNDDVNTITVTVQPASVLEDSGTSATFTFTRSGNALAPLSVTIQASGSATFNAADNGNGDYSVSGAQNFNGGTGTVVISAGTTQQNVLVTPIQDQVEESDETVTFTVVAGTGYEVGSPASATVTITNDDGNQNVVSISVSPSSVNEDSGIPLIFTVTRTGSISSPLTVPFSVSGNAIFGSDFSLAGATFFNGQSGVVTISAGSIQAVLTVVPQQDTIVEENELISIAILPPTDNTYTVNPQSFQATASILNDDVAVFTPENQLDNSFTIVGFIFPAKKKRDVPADTVIVLIVSNCLNVPRDRVAVVDVVGNFVRVRLLSEINGRSSATLARQLVLKINSRDLCIIGTALQGVQALFIPQTIEEEEEPVQEFSLQIPTRFPSPTPPPSPAPSPIPPPPSASSRFFPAFFLSIFCVVLALLPLLIA